IGDHGTDMELLLVDELVRGDDAGAMKADDHGLGDFGENTAIGIAADQKDGNLFGDTPTAADLLVGHLGNLGRGQEFYCFHDSRRRKWRPKISSVCCQKSTAKMAMEQASARNKAGKPQSLRGTSD